MCESSLEAELAASNVLRTSSSMRPALGLCALSRPSSSSVSSVSICSAQDSAELWTRPAKDSASSSRDACSSTHARMLRRQQLGVFALKLMCQPDQS